MKKNFFSVRSLCLLVTAISLFSCRKDFPGIPLPPGQRPGIEFYALHTGNMLSMYKANNPSQSLRDLTVTGLGAGENLIGIDFRPNTMQLFAISDGSRLYTINLSTGAATAVGTSPFSPLLSGDIVGFDFNPTVDRIRVVTSEGQNLRLNPENGTVAFVDGSINGAPGASITGVAYTQNKAGATSTVLFDIDVTNDKLYKQNPPNDGTLMEVGNLGVNAESCAGFDINPDSTWALAALNVDDVNGLYTINLTTGRARLSGRFQSEVIGLAIPTGAVAYAMGAGNNLMILDPLSGSVSYTKAITSLQAAETIIGIDMRPATGQLFALANTGNLYTLNIGTGAATLISTGKLSVNLEGSSFGVDFNPTVDRIRVVSNTGQNLRLSPLDGSVASVDADINPADITVSAAAYTNNFAGATTTVLYDIDAMAGNLVKQDPPNDGVVSIIGPLGITVDEANGFDIGGASGMAYGIFTSGNKTNIYTVNLTTGKATKSAAFMEKVTGFTAGLGL